MTAAAQERLERRLARWLDPAPSPLRHLSGADPVSALLDAVADTLLPRLLTVTSGQGASLTLAVADGQVLGLAAASDHILPDIATPLLDRSFEAAEPADAAALRLLFEALAGQGALTLRQARLDGPHPRTGLPVSALRRGGTPADRTMPPAGDRLPSLANALTRLDGTLILLDGDDVTLEQGNDAEIERLIDMATATPSVAEAEGHAVILTRSDGRSLLIAAEGRTQLLFEGPGVPPATLSTLWRDGLPDVD